MQRAIIEEKIKDMPTIETLHDEQTNKDMKDASNINTKGEAVLQKTNIDHDDSCHILLSCQR